MKIIHICHHYWPVIGGIENVVKFLSEGMVKLGHEVHVVTSIYGVENRPREEEVNDVYIHRVRAVRLRYTDLTIPREIPKDVLRGANAVHGHGQNSMFTVRILEEAKKLDVKTVIHFMAVDAFKDYPNPLIRLLAPHYGRWVLRKAVEVSDVKLVKSRRDKEILKKRYGIDTIYVPDGVPDELLKKPNMAKEFRGRHGINEPFVVYVGRLHQLKGVDVLIKAMSIVVKEMPELKAVIIGPGDQRPYKSLAHRLGVEKNVLFLGFVDEDTKISAIDASIALVLPSVCDYIEVFSLAISEAWARKKPVIVSAVGEMPYRVKHMVNGLLVQPKNPKELATAILTLFQRRKLAERLGENGYMEVRNNTWDKVIEVLIRLYQAKQYSI
ncbi:MAG: glycosyl transferase family 1 [Desulfurococcales archaeon ex4484_217_2]|nr:MAG: glycosyl transferase family 1 [Desulfurococcales archaeon ex4484_217_2]